MPNSKTAPAAPGKSAVNPPVTTKPAKAPVANTTLAAALTMAQVVAMSQPDRVAFFRAKDEAAGRIFIDLGKLFTGIEAALGKGEQIFPLLMKAGVRKGSVSNASQTARVFKEMVGGKVLAEAVFDTFRWGDICALNRVMSGGSKKKLTAAEAAKIVTGNPKRFDEELESIFTTGLSMADADKAATIEVARLEKELKEKAANEKKAAADHAATEALAKKAAEDKAKADAQLAVAKEKQKAATKATKTATTKADKDAAAKAQKQADEDAAAAAAAQAKAKEDAAAAKEQAKADAKAAKEKTIPLPPQNTTTLTACGEALDKLLDMVGKLAVAQQVAFFTTTWKAADGLLADSLKVAMKKSA